MKAKEGVEVEEDCSSPAESTSEFIDLDPVMELFSSISYNAADYFLNYVYHPVEMAVLDIVDLEDGPFNGLFCISGPGLFCDTDFGLVGGAIVASGVVLAKHFVHAFF